jgi:hypothetical protein
MTKRETRYAKVKFSIPENKGYGSSKEREGYRALCKEVFGIDLPEHFAKPVTITCWAHQFGCFLVRREELGLQNQFRTLTPKLLDYGRRTAEEECKYSFDVTREQC